MASLPYVTASGNVEKALNGIKSAATPERVSQDFVKTILKIPGGSGNQIASFLKKIGFVNADGTPSDIYKMFRNPSTTGKAAAKALKIGYPTLYKRNEFMHSLPDDELRGLVVEETGQSADSAVVTMIVNCMKPIKKLAKFTDDSDDHSSEHAGAHKSKKGIDPPPPPPPSGNEGLSGLNLSYTINLNLPATSDVAVFNAIFKSLKENLLKAQNED